MKKIIRIVILVIMLALAVNVPAGAESNGYVIDDYIVNVVVLGDGILEVEEIITVDFLYSKHGIYREIPLSGKYKIEANNVTTTQRFNCDVYDVSVENYDYEEYAEGNNYIIKMGNPDILLNGNNVYKFNYTLNFGNEKNDRMDWLYFYLIGNTWDTTINNGHFTITMPKAFDAENISVYSGYEGSKENNKTEYYTEGNAIHIDLIKPLYAYSGIVFQIILENGYFAEKAVETKNFNISDIDSIYIAIAGLVLLMFMVWLKFGKSPKLIPEDADRPPEGMTPAEIGYILDGVVDDRDVVSLLMHWASLGIIKIEEKNRDFIITKVYDKPLFENEYETQLFYDLFKSRLNPRKSVNSVSIFEIKTDFYKTIVKVKSGIIRKLSKNKDGGIYTRESKIAKKIAVFLCTTPYLLCIFKADMELNKFLAPFLVIYAAGSLFLTYGFRNLNEFIGVNIRRRKIFSFITALLFPITIIFPFYFMGKAIITFTHNYELMYIVFIAITIMGMLAANMHNPTEETIKIRQKILGFKMYLDNLNDEKIHSLLEDDEKYFHNILSYTYVLNMFGAWPNNFEKMITTYPDWYIVSNNPRLFSLPRFGRSFDSLSKDLTYGSVGIGRGGSGGAGGGMGGGGGSW